MQRYFKAEHLLDLLKTSTLFLSRLDNQSDPTEGMNTTSAKNHMLKRDLADGNEAWVSRVCSFAAEADTRKHAFGSFWTFDADFSNAKAREYGAVFSIVTTPQRMEEAIINKPEKISQLMIGPANYSDFRPRDNDITRMIFAKPRNLSWENECRLIALANSNSPNLSEKIKTAPEKLLLDLRVNDLIQSIRISPYANETDICLLDKFASSDIRRDSVGF